jgi:hypothetical protein
MNERGLALADFSFVRGSLMSSVQRALMKCSGKKKKRKSVGCWVNPSLPVNGRTQNHVSRERMCVYTTHYKSY